MDCTRGQKKNAHLKERNKLFVSLRFLVCFHGQGIVLVVLRVQLPQHWDLRIILT